MPTTEIWSTSRTTKISPAWDDSGIIAAESATARVARAKASPVSFVGRKRNIHVLIHRHTNNVKVIALVTARPAGSAGWRHAGPGSLGLRATGASALRGGVSR